MAMFDRDAISLYYEVRGEGAPLLLLAPGGLNSTVEFWERAAINPLTAYAGDFRLIAMDQRNAGASRGPLEVVDPWGAFIDDQIALMDHLGIERFLVMGCCIGCSYALKLIERAPGRVAAAVLEQPIAVIDENREGWVSRYQEWSAALLARRPELSAEQAARFGELMWGGDFVGAVSREFVATISTPIAVLPGIDEIHPTHIGLEIAHLAPSATLIDYWRVSPEETARATDSVRAYLRSNAPS